MTKTLHVDIAEPQHPILRGLAPWEMVDETYIMADPGDDSDLLLTTDHPESMKNAGVGSAVQETLACSVVNQGTTIRSLLTQIFRTVIARGIQWLAGRI